MLDSVHLANDDLGSESHAALTEPRGDLLREAGRSVMAGDWKVARRAFP